MTLQAFVGAYPGRHGHPPQVAAYFVQHRAAAADCQPAATCRAVDFVAVLGGVVMGLGYLSR